MEITDKMIDAALAAPNSGQIRHTGTHRGWEYRAKLYGDYKVVTDLKAANDMRLKLQAAIAAAN